MESSWKKPYGKMAKAKPAPAPGAEQAGDTQEDKEIAEAQAKREAKTAENEDKIGALIGGTYFVTNWTNPVLAHPTLPQMSVARFYPEAFIAIDIFSYVGDWERKIIEYKRKQFAENEVEFGGKKGRVRYGALSYSDPLAALAPQLEV